MSLFKAVARLKSNTNKAHRQKAWRVKVFSSSFHWLWKAHSEADKPQMSPSAPCQDSLPACARSGWDRRGPEQCPCCISRLLAWQSSPQLCISHTGAALAVSGGSPAGKFPFNLRNSPGNARSAPAQDIWFWDTGRSALKCSSTPRFQPFKRWESWRFLQLNHWNWGKRVCSPRLKPRQWQINVFSPSPLKCNPPK